MIAPGDLHLGYMRAYNVVKMRPVSFNRHIFIAYRGSVSFIKSDDDIDENFLSTHFEWFFGTFLLVKKISIAILHVK